MQPELHPGRGGESLQHVASGMWDSRLTQGNRVVSPYIDHKRELSSIMKWCRLYFYKLEYPLQSLVLICSFVPC